MSGAQTRAGATDDRHRAKWAAFWLSLAVPGSGQLWAGRAACLGYFTASSLLTAGALSGGSAWGFRLGLGVLALWSAETAKRAVEIEPRDRPGPRPEVVVADRRVPGRGIDLGITLTLRRSAGSVWRQMADLPGFVTIDPFHSRLVVLGPALRPGVSIVLEHNAYGIRFRRFGHLLSWREGVGYAFSDLGPRGRNGFFPHVFTFAVEPIDEAHSRLTIRVRGLWTSSWVPRSMGRLWFRHVAREHGRMLRKALA